MRWQGLVATVIGVAFLMCGTASAEVRTERLKCLEGRAELIREHPTNQTRKAFDACRDEIAREVPYARSTLKQRAILTHLVAYEMAPYGSSTHSDLRGLLAERFLNCGSYGVLAYRLHRSAWGKREARKYVQVGWDHGPFGNHAQTMVGGLLIDPTIGAIAKTTYAQLLAGHKVREVVSYKTRDDIPEFRANVIGALLGGEYRREHILYRGTIASYLH